MLCEAIHRHGLIVVGVEESFSQCLDNILETVFSKRLKVFRSFSYVVVHISQVFLKTFSTICIILSFDMLCNVYPLLAGDFINYTNICPCYCLH